MRVWLLVGLLTAAVAAAVACGSSDDKKLAQEAGGEAAGGARGGDTGAPNAGEMQGPHPDSGGVSAAAGAVDGGNSFATAGDDGAGAAPTGVAGDAGVGGATSVCEAAPAALAATLEGHWLICGALASNGRIWNGLLTFDTCSGAALTGSFHWLTTNSGTSEGNTLFNGSYDAESGTITLEEYEVTGGNVVTATDTFKYDADSDTLTDGAWTCGCSPGTWTSATRVPAGTDVDACP
ncbi:MAG TPA: hypothetical protein VHB79_38915 [Polyangiaceae bacterium]|nr:hypothetical protein [Polyangiaceae bacterium]